MLLEKIQKENYIDYLDQKQSFSCERLAAPGARISIQAQSVCRLSGEFSAFDSSGFS